jgi:hypothetical protein
MMDKYTPKRGSYFVAVLRAGLRAGKIAHHCPCRCDTYNQSRYVSERRICGIDIAGQERAFVASKFTFKKSSRKEYEYAILKEGIK